VVLEQKQEVVMMDVEEVVQKLNHVIMEHVVHLLVAVILEIIVWEQCINQIHVVHVQEQNNLIVLVVKNVGLHQMDVEIVIMLVMEEQLHVLKQIIMEHVLGQEQKHVQEQHMEIVL